MERRERREVYYRGRVQGVGFRYTARQLAGRFAVAGYVENLPDRRVRLVAEGLVDQLDGFLTRLDQAMSDYIADTQVTVSDTTDEFAGFDIRH